MRNTAHLCFDIELARSTVLSGEVALGDEGTADEDSNGNHEGSAASS